MTDVYLTEGERVVLIELSSGVGSSVDVAERLGVSCVMGLLNAARRRMGFRSTAKLLRWFEEHGGGVEVRPNKKQVRWLRDYWARQGRVVDATHVVKWQWQREGVCERCSILVWDRERKFGGEMAVGNRRVMVGETVLCAYCANVGGLHEGAKAQRKI